MNDFTLLTTSPIPLDIQTLTNANTKLMQKCKNLKWLLFAVGGLAIVAVIVNIYIETKTKI